jgi:exopolysaccharide production protein ExoY
MLKEQANTFERVARTTDLGLIVLSFAASSAICDRFKGITTALAWVPGRGNLQTPASSDQYALLFISSLVGWFAVTRWRNTYLSARSRRARSVVFQELVTQVSWALTIGCSSFFLKLTLISREFMAMFVFLAILTLNMRAIGSQLILRYVRTKGFNLRDIVLLGEPQSIEQFTAAINTEATSGYRIVHLPNSTDDQITYFDANEIDEAFVLMGTNVPKLDAMVLKLVKQGKRVHFVPGFLDAKQFRQSLSEFAGIPILSLGGYGLSPGEAILKRTCDVLGSIILLIAFAPLMGLVAILVKCTSPGPVIFTQERIGEGGKRFRIYKYRTMYRDAEQILNSNPALYKRYVDNSYKLPKGCDPRITSVGDFLRRTSLDELPQLLNVLLGHMSLVGPRPVVPPEIKEYGDYANLLMSVKPGVTGNWQVNGRSEIDDYSQRATLDVEYIRDQSFRHDVDILLKTIPAVLMRRGAH